MKSEQFDDAVALLKKLYRDEQFVLVAVDGHSAAGKFTFARKLQAALRDVQLVHGDDFYRVMSKTERFKLAAPQGYRRYYDWERLEQQVLAPLAARREARYRAYSWETGTLRDAKVVQPHGTVIVEGVFCARPELRSFYDAIFLMDTGAETRA